MLLGFQVLAEHGSDDDGKHWDDYQVSYEVQVKVNGLENRLKAKLKPVVKGFWNRNTIGFRWEGTELAQVLNRDAHLMTLLPPLCVEIRPYKKQQCVRVCPESIYNEECPLDSSVDVFPTIEIFEAFDEIAQHIRAIASS